jgi:small subunit ribosomal protein S20
LKKHSSPHHETHHPHHCPHRHRANAPLRTRPKTAGDKAAAAKVFQAAQATIDKIADKKVVHKNTAARTKSRLSAAVKGMAA